MVYSNRYELKYIIDVGTFARMRSDIDRFFVYDKNGDENGSYFVSSLYYDSPDYRFYDEKIDGEKVRSKVRIRTYLDADGKHRVIDYGQLRAKNKVVLEIKKKNNRNIMKRKVLMFEHEAEDFIKNPNTFYKIMDNYSKSDQHILAEIAYLNMIYKLKPSIIVQYKRQAFYSKYQPKIRLTFDTNVKCRSNNLTVYNLHSRDYFLKPSLGVLEIKYNTILPVWINQIIKKYSLPVQAFSKYCSALDQIINRNEYFINKAHTAGVWG